MQHHQQSTAAIEGIVPVMLTPFDDAGAIDYAGLERLIEWYLAHGSDALFAVAQSSEMQFLSLAERAELARFVVDRVAGRVPVVASGHISDDLDSQVAELCAAAESGAQGVVLVTNHLDPQRKGSAAFWTIFTRCSPGCRRICRSACTNVRRLIDGCSPMTSCVRASIPAAS
jgi:4-hydroxy-tetrahydrodipicolinate synthase